MSIIPINDELKTIPFLYIENDRVLRDIDKDCLESALGGLGDECVEDEGNELTVYKLMVAPKGSSYFQTVVVPRPTGSLLPSEPYPFLSFTEAAKWVDDNLNTDLHKWFVEKI